MGSTYKQLIALLKTNNDRYTYSRSWNGLVFAFFSLLGIEPTLGVAPALEAELFVILSPVGPYYSCGVQPVNLLADPDFVRAWPGGSGYSKMGSNYAPTLYISVRNIWQGIKWSFNLTIFFRKSLQSIIVIKHYGFTVPKKKSPKWVPWTFLLYSVKNPGN